MRPTSFIGLLGLGVLGVIAADFLTHPKGTNAIGNAVVAETKIGGNALLGVPTR